MLVSGSSKQRIVVETIEDEQMSPLEERSRQAVARSAPTQKHWKPGELRSSLSQKIGESTEAQHQVAPQLPDFFHKPEDELLDIKGMAQRGLSGISNMNSIAMSVPAFLTILALLTGFSFFAGRVTVSSTKRAAATEATPTLAPVSVLPQGSGAPVQGTPDEIVSAARLELSLAIEASKKEALTEQEKQDVSTKILHVLDVLTKGIASYPDVASLYFERAQVEKMVMQSAPTLKAQAEADYAKALVLSPLTHEYYVGYADYLEVVGEQQKAGENYEKAIQLNPKSIDAMYPLARLYTAAGKKAEAKTLLTKILGFLSANSAQYAQIQKEISALEPTPTPESMPSPDTTATASGTL